uniref:BPTI/Kunitz inhibitor domain-containing protein n=1 Tax=Sinocyclocheilus rhinocerous TaxID=307959 RepID=A0A673J251_9TELE
MKCTLLWTDSFIYCYLPKKPGECVGHYLRYYYSPEHHTCKSFYWTGCVGNGNRFLTLSWCLEDYSGESDVPVGK